MGSGVAFCFWMFWAFRACGESAGSYEMFFAKRLMAEAAYCAVATRFSESFAFLLLGHKKPGQEKTLLARAGTCLWCCRQPTRYGRYSSVLEVLEVFFVSSSVDHEKLHVASTVGLLFQALPRSEHGRS